MNNSGIGYCFEIPNVPTSDPGFSFNFSRQKFVSLKIVVRISYAVKGVFRKDLGPALGMAKDHDAKAIPCFFLDFQDGILFCL